MRRAAELERVESVGERGRSLADLEQIAREAGIDPTLVRRAAQEIEERSAEQEGSGFTGAPTTVKLERTVQGELPDTEYERIVEEVRRAFGTTGIASTLGRTLTWTSTMEHRHDHPRSLSVSITPRDGRTTIRVQERFRSLAGGLFGGILGGLGGAGLGASLAVGMAVFDSGGVALLSGAAVVSGAYLLARTIFSAVVGRRTRELREVLDSLADEVARVTPTTVREP
jgi:uncharacterized OsmC-like protein